MGGRPSPDESQRRTQSNLNLCVNSDVRPSVTLVAREMEGARAVRIKLVALDIDGTLLTPTGEVSPRVRHTIRLVRSLGVSVVLATGRRLRSTLPVLYALGLEGAVITNNGGLLIDTLNWNVLHQAVLQPQESNGAIALVQQHEAPWWTYRHCLRGPDVLVPLNLGPQRFAWPLDADQWTYLDGSVAEPILSLTTWGPAQRIRPIVEQLQGIEHPFEVLYLPNESPDTMLELMPKGTSKAAALAVLCDRLGIAPGEVLAIGDNYNDIAMLRWAGLGIAMGNAPAPVAAAAKLSTLSNEQDGVAAALMRHVIGMERTAVSG